jgi:putative membrane protein
MNMKKVIGLQTSLLLFALSLGSAYAKDSENSKQNLDQFQKTQVLNRIHHINEKEIAVSKLAKKKAESDEVKGFADHMIQDHQNVDRKLKDLAKSEKIKLQSFQPAGFEKATLDQLSKLKGSQFDQAFVDVMKSGHQEALNTLDMFNREVKDPKIQNFIQEVIPSLKKHEGMATGYGSKHQMAGQMEESSQ